MQKNSKIKIGKSITAVLLCAVLLVTSLPLVLAKDPSTYDPVPTFDDKDKSSLSAVLGDDGGITVSFPEAKVSNRKTAKSVSGYMLELVDLGTYTEVHTSTILLRKMVSPTGTAPYTAEITADEIKKKVPEGLSDDHRYNVSVTAYDSEGWFSETLNAFVSDIPVYVYDKDAYAPVTNNALAAREVLTFEGKANSGDGHGTYSDYGTNERTDSDNNTRGSTGSLDFMQSGGHLSYGGMTDQVGADSPTAGAVDTKGYRLRIESAVTQDSPQSFDTAWSRQTWNTAGATEIWYWLDFSQVSVTGLSFRLRSNDKWFAQDFDNSYSNDNTYDRYGDIIYSTVGTTKAGYMGEDPYIFLQQEDGSWKKVMLNDGTVDLDHFKGYVRIPLQFMCSETDSVVTDSNADFGINNPVSDMYVWNDSDKTKANADKYYNDSIKLSQSVVVDPAGTSISDALLVRHYSFRINKTSWTSGSYYIDGGMMLAPCVDTSDGSKTTADSPRRAYIDKTKIGTGEDPVVNRENGYKAIEDLMSAGFKFTGCTYDASSTTLETRDGSVGKSIFFDNVLFYRTDGEEYSSNTLNGSVNTGSPVKNYYDQETEIPRAIFNACDKYIETPDYSDFRAVKYIEDLIAGYKKAVKEYNADNSGTVDASFLDDDKLDAKAAELGMSAAWQKFKDAKKACQDAGTYGSENSGAEDIIPMLAKSIEKLPAFNEETLYVSDEDKAEVKKIYNMYIKLNLGQLNMLGKANEEKILKYFDYMENELANNSVVVGQSLTNNKYIPFANFDNLKTGTRAWQFENSKNVGTVGSDYYYTKGFMTYTVPFAAISAHSTDLATPTLIPSGALGNDPQRNGITDYKQNAAWATVTNGGSQGSKGATVKIDSQYYESKKGWYNGLSVTKNLTDANTYDELRNGNNMSSESLGDFAHTYNKSDKVNETDRLALVFYADFSQISDFSMAFNISSYYDGAADDYTLDAGSDVDNAYFYIINPNTGEWAKCTAQNEGARRIYNYTSEYGIDTNGDGTVDMTINNYKGYIMIPLFQFRRGVQGISASSNYRLDEKAEALNNIFRISIGVAPVSEASAKNMDGKSFTIDSIGFTYAQGSYYGDKVNSRNDAGFDEFLQVKSFTAAQFEAAVADIDMYKKNTRTEKINTALALYAKLTDYQKSIKSVTRAYDVLTKYKNINDGIEKDVDNAEIVPADLKTKIEALSSKATGASITGDYDLPYPGLITDPTDSTKAVINYDAYGLTAEGVQEVIDMYEKSYKRYTDEALTALGTEDAQKLENAYNAAKRLRLLEEYLDGFKSDSGSDIIGLRGLRDKLLAMYATSGTETDLTEALKLVPTKNADNEFSLDAIKDYNSSYTDLDYYAKVILRDGKNLPTAYAGYGKAATAIPKVLANIQTYTDDFTGKTVKGGVVRLEEKYTALYNTVKSAMDSNGIQNLDAITEAVDEYNSFISCFHNIQEVNDGNAVGSSENEALHGINDVLRLFPNFTAETDKDSVALNKDAPTGTATFNLLNAVDYPDGSYTLRVTSQNGGLKDAAGGVHDYTVAMTGVIDKTANASALKTSPETADIENNTASAANPKTVGFTFTVDPTKVTTTSDDVIIIELVDKTTGEVAVDKTTNEPVRKTITLHFAADDFFEVTIPAEIDVPWGETNAVDVSYKVTSSLDTGSSLSVSVARSASVADDTLTNAATTTYALPYTSQNFKSTVFTGVNSSALPADKPEMVITGWQSAPIAEYSTTLTYTVDYTKG